MAFLGDGEFYPNEGMTAADRATTKCRRLTRCLLTAPQLGRQQKLGPRAASIECGLLTIRQREGLSKLCILHCPRLCLACFNFSWAPACCAQLSAHLTLRSPQRPCCCRAREWLRHHAAPVWEGTNSVNQCLAKRRALRQSRRGGLAARAML